MDSKYLSIENKIRQLSEVYGPTAFEGGACTKAMELLAPYVDEVRTDLMGNLIGVKRCGKEGAKKVLLDAHLDEVGLIITGVQDGFLKFNQLGGVDPRVLVNHEVVILCDEPVHGVITCMPPHIQSSEDMDKACGLDEMWIDVGDQLDKVEVGTPVVFSRQYSELAGNKICGNALDDRCCMAVLIRTMELLKDTPLDVDIYVLCSAREETSSAGAIIAANAIVPDCAIVVDVTHGTTSDHKGDDSFKLGGGPAIGCGPNINRGMYQQLCRCADKLEMAYAVEVMSGCTGTNAWDIQIAQEGIATAIVSVPLRYMHTPAEVISLKDVEDMAELLACYLGEMGKEAAV